MSVSSSLYLSPRQKKKQTLLTTFFLKPLPIEKKTHRLAKRIFDFIVATGALIVLSPLFFVLAACIKTNSKGPIIFRSLRIGKNGTPFWMFKFRTMQINSEAIVKQDKQLAQIFATDYKIPNDPRVTSFGKILRRTCLDELPQLINILKGEMSFVGPRPILKEELSKVPLTRLTATPGLTGLWQVKGKSALSYEKKIALDEEYIHDQNFLLDLKILLQTLPAIIKGKGFSNS